MMSSKNGKNEDEDKERGDSVSDDDRGDDSVVSSEESSDDDDDSGGELDLKPSAAGVAGGRGGAADESSSSSSDDDGGDDEEEGDAIKEKNSNGSSEKKRKKNDERKAKKANKKSKKSSDDDDTIQVDFTFCDMNQKYFHGIRSLLTNSGTVYNQSAAHSSAITDHMIDNDIIGTVVSTEGDADNNVYGFASVLSTEQQQQQGNSTGDQDQQKEKQQQYEAAIQYLKDVCLKDCPTEYRKALENALSNKQGKSKKNQSSAASGFLVHGRMVNLPLQITLVLHQQLLLDMDWAIQNQRPDENFNYTKLVRLAPCQREKQQGGGAASSSSQLIYRYFDDEVFASHADFSFTVDAPKSYSKEEKQLLTIMVLSKKGHRDAVRDLEMMIGSG